MSTAILGWGSLIWDPRDLQQHIGPWLKLGPVLPIESSRVSSGRWLTLVIDDENGVRGRRHIKINSIAVGYAIALAGTGSFSHVRCGRTYRREHSSDRIPIR